MNNADIDNLSGRELKAAIAAALGYTLRLENLPDWQENIAAAWELDGVGYTFSFNESHAIGGCVTCTLTPNRSPIVQASVFMGNTKSVAYAVARCRAWLKAQSNEVPQ